MKKWSKKKRDLDKNQGKSWRGIINILIDLVKMNH